MPYQYPNISASAFRSGILAIIVWLACPQQAAATVLVGNADVSGLLSDFWSGNLLVFVLTPPATPTYLCGVSGNNGGTDGTWAFAESDLETNSSAVPAQTNVEKAYALLNVAWLTGMKIQIESSGTTTDCSDDAYISLHNPAYP